MPNQRSNQFTLLIKAANKSVFITEVNLLVTETKATYKSVITLSLECSWCVKDMVSRIIHSIRSSLFIFKQLTFSWTSNWYSFCQFGQFEIPNSASIISRPRYQELTVNSILGMQTQHSIFMSLKFGFISFGIFYFFTFFSFFCNLCRCRCSVHFKFDLKKKLIIQKT
jgi:hypothetical protein